MTDNMILAVLGGIAFVLAAGILVASGIGAFDWLVSDEGGE